MVAVNLTCDDDGNIAEARIAVGACSPVAQRLLALEKILIGQHPKDVTIAPAFLEQLTPIDDVRGTTEFRLEVVAEQCARAIRMAAGHA